MTRAEVGERIASLAASAVARLGASGQTVAVAESCTGGWLGKEITSVAGASRVFWGGVVVYADASKSALLPIAPELIGRHGAVSEEVAMAMASGVRRLSGADWGVGITGIAGPTGGTPAKPVGTVYVAVDGATAAARAYKFSGERNVIRHRAVAAALSLLEDQLASPDG